MHYLFFVIKSCSKCKLCTCVNIFLFCINGVIIKILRKFLFKINGLIIDFSHINTLIVYLILFNGCGVFPCQVSWLPWFYWVFWLCPGFYYKQYCSGLFLICISVYVCLYFGRMYSNGESARPRVHGSLPVAPILLCVWALYF